MKASKRVVETVILDLTAEEAQELMNFVARTGGVKPAVLGTIYSSFRELGMVSNTQTYWDCTEFAK